MSDYPTLAQFLGAYLHQDWAHDYDDVWGAVSDFLDSEPENAQSLITDINDLLAQKTSEADLEAVVAELDGNYRAEFHGETYRSWLTEMAERVNKVLKEQQ